MTAVLLIINNDLVNPMFRSSDRIFVLILQDGHIN